MNPSEIVRKGTLCVALLVGACSFNVPKEGGPSGSGGTGIHITGTGGSFTTGQGGNGNAAGGMECGLHELPSTKLPPDILIVQDASGSMNEDAMNMTCPNGGCGATSKWALMIPAINMVVQQTETTVNWGLKLFADSGSCGVTNNAAVPVAAMNSAAVMTALANRTAANGGVSNGSSTPTRAAEAAAVTYLSGLQDMNPKYIVLATDGQPNCPMSGNQQNDDTTAAVAAVAAAKAANIPTFVVGISAGGAPEAALNMMAEAGGFPQTGQATEYYPVSSTAEFVTVLQTLVGMAGTCTFSVPDPPTTDGTTSRGDIGVRGTTNGTVGDIPMDGTNGWTYGDPNDMTVILHGSACDQVMAGTTTAVTIVFHCHVP
jgi:hypothetical protein